MALATESAGLGGQILRTFDDDPVSGRTDTMAITTGGVFITATPSRVAFAGMTLSQGAPGKAFAGRLVSLNIAGQLAVGSKPVELTS